MRAAERSSLLSKVDPDLRGVECRCSQQSSRRPGVGACSGSRGGSTQSWGAGETSSPSTGPRLTQASLPSATGPYARLLLTCRTAFARGDCSHSMRPGRGRKGGTPGATIANVHGEENSYKTTEQRYSNFFFLPSLEFFFYFPLKHSSILTQIPS